MVQNKSNTSCLNFKRSAEVAPERRNDADHEKETGMSYCCAWNINISSYVFFERSTK